jgi:hypothetical protein
MAAEPNKYWFARRFPVGNPRNKMAPISPEGHRVVGAFVGAMVGGAAGWAVLSLFSIWVPFLWVLGIVIFVAASAWGGWYFITQAQARGDHQHTVEDYKSGRVKQ